jgi:hypothetical protein
VGGGPFFLIRDRRALLRIALGGQAALEGIEHLGYVIDELRARQRGGALQVRIRIYCLPPSRENRLAPRSQVRRKCSKDFAVLNFAGHLRRNFTI